MIIDLSTVSFSGGSGSGSGGGMSLEAQEVIATALNELNYRLSEVENNQPGQ